MSQIIAEPVFKVKDEQDGTKRLKSRIVSLGYSMVPGKDYVNSYSPVVTGASVRTAFAVSLYIMNHTKLHNCIEQLKYERKTKVAKERTWR
jgi:hypothetical protein